MSVPSVTTRSSSSDEMRSARNSAIRMSLSWLAVSIVFLAAIYLASLSSGTAPEDFGSIAIPP